MDLASRRARRQLLQEFLTTNAQALRNTPEKQVLAQMVTMLGSTYDTYWSCFDEAELSERFLANLSYQFNPDPNA